MLQHVKTVRLALKIYAWFSYDSKIKPPFGIYSVQEISKNGDGAIESFVKIYSLLKGLNKLTSLVDVCVTVHH